MYLHFVDTSSRYFCFMVLDSVTSIMLFYPCSARIDVIVYWGSGTVCVCREW